MASDQGPILSGKYSMVSDKHDSPGCKLSPLIQITKLLRGIVKIIRPRRKKSDVFCDVGMLTVTGGQASGQLVSLRDTVAQYEYSTSHYN